MKRMNKWYIIAVIAVALCALALPAHTIAKEAAYTANIGKQAQFDTDTTLFSIVSDPTDITADGVFSEGNTLSRGDIPTDLTVEIKDCYYNADEGIYWYRIAAAAGHTLPAAFPDTPWVFQNYTNRLSGNALLFGDFTAADSDADADNAADDAADTAPVIPDLPSISDADSGVEVYTAELPAGATLTVEQADTTAQIDEFGIDADRVVGSLDISVQGADGADWQPTEGVLVQMPVDADPGTKVGLLHTHEGVTQYIGTTTVAADSTVLIAADGFSEFVSFTVDFHYQNVDYSIPGESTITLSALFEAMGIDEDAAKATAVVFSDPTLVAVHKIDNDWELESLVAFDTNETLIITFEDNRTVVIDVTDEQYHIDADLRYHYLFGSGGQASGDDLVNEYHGSYGFIIRYGHKKGTAGTYDVDFYYDDANGNNIAKDTGTHYFNLTDLGTKFKTQDNSLWFHIYSTEYMEINEDPSRTSLQLRAKVKLGGGQKVRFKAYSTAVSFTESAAKSICSMSIDSRLSTETEYRNIELYLNGVKIGTVNNVLFPNRNRNDEDFDQHNGLHISYNSSRYRADTVSRSYGDGTQTMPYSYNESTKTYTIRLYDYGYQLNYDLQGGSGSFAAQTAGPKAATSHTFTLSSSTPTRAGYTFKGWANTAGAATADYAAGATITVNGTTSSNGSTITATKTVYAVWSRNNYTIGYTLNGGTVATANPTTYHAETNTFTLNNPTKPNYIFTGWTGSNGTTPQTTVTISKGSSGNRTYTANWRAEDYSITYNLGGGTVANANPASYTIESNAITLNNPTRTGYTFLGWTGSNGSTPQTTVTIAKGSTGTKSYTANWRADTYNITYNLAGGTLATANPTTYTVESGAFTLHNPTKPGYTFAGWTGTGLSAAATTVTVATGSTGARTYTATWTPNNYTITYNYNGGHHRDNTAQTVTSATATSGSSNYYEVAWLWPTRAGYTFAGWYTADGAQVYGADGYCIPCAYWDTANRWIGTADLTVYAHWTANKYTVTLNAGDGDGDDRVVDGEYDTPITLPANTYTHDVTVTYHGNGGNHPAAATVEATFIGWRVDGTGELITDGAQLENLTAEADGNVTLVAQWAYNTVTLPAAQWEGHTFAGWATAAEGGTWVGGNGDDYAPTADVTVYARWSNIRYTITYVVNMGGTASVQSDYDYDTAVTLHVPTVPAGYRFAGWRVEEAVGSWNTGIYQPGQVMGTANYGSPTLTAIWVEQYRYVLHFDAGEGSGAPATIDSGWQDGATYAAAWTTVPTRKNYRFMGWAETPDGTANAAGAGYNAYALSGGTATKTLEKTLYAIWVLDTGHLKLAYSGNGNPAVVTITGSGTTITTVIDQDTVIRDLIVGEYTVTVDAAYAADGAAASAPTVSIEAGETATVGITVTDRALSWIVGFCRRINVFGRAG